MKESQSIEWKESWNDDYIKWICGFANAQGGDLFIGINDHGEVIGLQNAKKLLEDIPNKIYSSLGIVVKVNLEKEGDLEYLRINVSPSNSPIAFRGVYHYRTGSTKQELKGIALQDFLLKKLGVSWELLGNEYATLKDISPNAIDYFQKKAIANNRMNKDLYTKDIKRVLDNLRLFNSKGEISNAALLLFGKDPAKYIPLAEFQIGRFSSRTGELLFQDIVEGNIIQMADKVIELLKSKYLICPVHYKSIFRLEPLEIPEDALREAICNAIVHKDYSSYHIQMRIYDDKITLWNYGSLPDELTPEKLYEDHSSYPRNKNIADVFYKAGLIEHWGQGINKIIRLLKKVGIAPPIIEDSNGGVKITIFRNLNFLNSLDNELSDTQFKILELINVNPKITRKAISEKMDISMSTVARNISKMQNYVEYKGSGRTGYWVIIKKQQNG